MSLQAMSYDAASDVFNAYCDLMVGLEKLEKYQVHCYSDLKSNHNWKQNAEIFHQSKKGAIELKIQC